MKIWILGLALLGLSRAFATESMPQMPLAREKRVFTVTGNEDFEDLRGFGKASPGVRMRNLMMVEGSEMEGMDMSGMSASPTSQKIRETGVTNASPFEIQLIGKPNPRVGRVPLDFQLLDSKTRQPIKGMALEAQVFMTGMDMGTEEPKVQEVEPGHYRVNAPFSMQGPWAVRIRVKPGDAKDPSRAWENTLRFDVSSGQ